MSHFIHLDVHSEYSISDSVIRLNALIGKNKAEKNPAVAISDRSNIFAAIKLYRKAMKEGIQPIIGTHIRVGHSQLGEGELLLYAQNQTGYRHICELLTMAYEVCPGEEYPLIHWDDLAAKSEGLLLVSQAGKGVIRQALLEKQEMAWGWCDLLNHAFANKWYIAIQRIGQPDEEKALQAVVELASQQSIPVLATNAVRFLEKTDFAAHEARVAIQQGFTLADPHRPHNYTEEQYHKTAEEMQALFADIPEAISNTVTFAQRCHLTFTFNVAIFPEFHIKEDIPLEDYFKNMSRQGLDARLEKTHPDATLSIKQPYYDRLQTELATIIGMGFVDYFLVVADFIQWSKNNGVPVGPGRGSGAGSVVAYALGITDLDPLEFDLLFERFLNPERVSLPDFDVDFCMSNRDRVIDYVCEHYGHDSVSQIITFGTMAAKAVVRDVGRILGQPYFLVDKLAKLIPFEIGITLEKALEEEEQLRHRYEREEEVKAIIDLALQLEGLVRNVGKHAGGVVIAPQALSQYLPLYFEQKGHPVSQFDKDDLELVGLVKFDFLGLRNLTIIQSAVDQINARKTSEEDMVDIQSIALDDEKTFRLLKRCETSAVFQLESSGMKDLIKRLQPDCFEDIIALVALFRPGPLQSGMVDSFIDRKHGKEVIEYMHDSLEEVLKPTYGVILYQEQVMEIGRRLSGYSLGGADLLRRAMGKKKPEEMAKQRSIFVEGAENNNVAASKAEHIFDLIEKFAGYGFNKSHSAAYALIAYQTAWLKAHYPAEFMAAVLSSDMDNTDKVVFFLDECKSMGIKVIAADVNTCQYAFTVNPKGHIVYGLGAIKGVGQAAIESLVDERNKQGDFKNLFGFCQRVDLHKFNKRTMEPLIFSGAFDSFGLNRPSLLATLPHAVKSAEQHNRNKKSGQTDMFSTATGSAADNKQHIIHLPAWPKRTLLEKEKLVLGFYLSGHPFSAYRQELKKMLSMTIAGMSKTERKKVCLAGSVDAMRFITTKKGHKMAVLSLADETGKCDVTLFSDVLTENRDWLANDKIVLIKGERKWDEFRGAYKITAQSIQDLFVFRQQYLKGIKLYISEEINSADMVKNLQAVLKPYIGGTTMLSLSVKNNEKDIVYRAGKNWKLRCEDELLDQLELTPYITAVDFDYDLGIAST